MIEFRLACSDSFIEIIWWLIWPHTDWSTAYCPTRTSGGEKVSPTPRLQIIPRSYEFPEESSFAISRDRQVFLVDFYYNQHQNDYQSSTYVRCVI